MTLSDDVAYATATELAARIRRRDLSPVELLDAVITRIEARNPSLNALVFTAFDEARDRAKEAERALTSGQPLGLLHGVPTAIKDLFDFKPGWRATLGGIRALRDFSVPAYCTYAERMEAAGAVLVGKTNSPVMGFRGTCDNYLFGPSRNPFDQSRNTGGSSGGSAAAVADGLLPLAEGTDGGGLYPDSCRLVQPLRVQGIVRPRPLRRPPQRLRLPQSVPVRGSPDPHRRRRRPGPGRAGRL